MHTFRKTNLDSYGAFTYMQVDRANSELSMALQRETRALINIEEVRNGSISGTMTEQEQYEAESRISEIERNELHHSRIEVETAETKVSEAVKNREATLHRLGTIELDKLLQEYCAIWSALSDMILPLMSVTKLQQLDAKTYQTDVVDHFIELFEEKFTYKGFYMHLFRSGHVSDDVSFMQKNFPSMSFTFFSAQRSEHGNKLVKLLMLHMYGIDSSQSSFAFIIADQNTRCVYYIYTCVAIGTYACSSCGSLGHNKNNLVFH